MHSKILAAGLCAAALACAGGAHAANIVTNGDFETGDFTGWNANASSDHPWSVTSSGPVEGMYAASTGCIGAQCTDASTPASAAYLWQDLSTTAGGVYTLTFEFSPNGGTPNELKVLWNGALALDLVDTTDTGALVTYTVSGLVATGGSSLLEFLGRQDPGYDRLDNIDVEMTGTSAAPEPSTWALMLAGVGLAGFALRSRRQVALAAA